MSDFAVRKIVTVVEEIRHDGGPAPGVPRRRGAVLAVVSNPYAGRFVEDVATGMKALEPLGLEMSERLIAALGGDIAAIDAYGKGVLVGAEGELEHGALWHVPGGYAMRSRLGAALAIVPSAKKVAGIGARLDVPIGHVNAAYVRSHFDAMEVGVHDAPRPNELLLCLVMACGPRVHARMGGLAAEEIAAFDGLR